MCGYPSGSRENSNSFVIPGLVSKPVRPLWLGVSFAKLAARNASAETTESSKLDNSSKPGGFEGIVEDHPYGLNCFSMFSTRRVSVVARSHTPINLLGFAAYVRLKVYVLVIVYLCPISGPSSVTSQITFFLYSHAC